MFSVDYFGTPAYLAQSPQLYKQIMVGALERVFEVGPAFRAEPHDTARHLAECVSLDAELGFIDDPRDVMAVARHAVAGMIECAAAQAGSAVALLGAEPPAVPAEIPARALRRRPAAARGRPRRARRRRGGPGARARALARRLGGARARLGLALRDRLPDGQAPVPHASGADPPRVLAQLRPAVPRGSS